MILARVVRSGLVESQHDGALAAVDRSGRVVLALGDVERRFFFRSAAKPFQAAVSLELGGAMADERVALACASHGGRPAHVALVRAILAEADLGPEALRCPPSWPLSTGARDAVIAAGHRSPRPEWHNCSGKHAAMLRACVAQGWSIDDYLDPDHPLQRRIYDLVAEVTGEDPGPVGVDGCGAPVFRVSALGIARAYAALATRDDLAPIWSAMHRFPALVSDVGNGDATLATWGDLAAKRGAEGCLGVAVRGRLGIGAKAWDGAERAVTVAVGEALRRLQALPSYTDDRWEPTLLPAVLGGGRPVGRIEPVLEEV